MKVAWISTWDRVCGIADYSKSLWPSVESELARKGGQGFLISQDAFGSTSALLRRLEELQPDLIHVQHEYGIWGGKNPPFYRFPEFARRVRQALPRARLAATAHMVIPPGYRFPVRGRGIEAPVRALANLLLLGPLTRVWQEGTWSPLDGVIAHSRHQRGPLLGAGARSVEVIPHFVHSAGVKGTVPRGAPARPRESRTVVVFGFFTPEKGQDVAIEALALLPPGTRLILAGGVWRGRDQSYQDRCLARAKELKVLDRLEVTGFVEPKRVDALFAAADLVLAPFRETSGSGSLAQGLARGKAVLASDLLLNRELDEREPGALAFFRSGDAADCARELGRLLADDEARARLQNGARRYAEACSPAETAKKHLSYYERLLADANHEAGASPGGSR